jgi:hypothetical protein
MRVEPVMSRDVVTIGIDDSCEQALSRMLHGRSATCRSWMRPEISGLS